MTQVLYPTGEQWSVRYKDEHEDTGSYLDSDGKVLIGIDTNSYEILHSFSESMPEDFDAFFFFKSEQGTSVSEEKQVVVKLRTTSMPSFFDIFEIYLEDCNGLTATYGISDNEVGKSLRIDIKNLVTQEGFNPSFIVYSGIHIARPRSSRKLDVYMEDFSYSSAPTPKYITPDEVVAGLQLYLDNGELFRPTPQSSPAYEQWCQWIVEAEAFVEEQTRQAWSIRRKKDEYHDIESSMGGGGIGVGSMGQALLMNMAYQSLPGGTTSGLFGPGIEFKLNFKNVHPLDSSKGDKLEVCWIKDNWRDITDAPGSHWVDRNRGNLMVRHAFIRGNYGLRITYRHGSDGQIPEDIKRCIILYVGKQFLNTDRYRTIFPMAPGFDQDKANTINSWTWEIKDILKNYADTIQIGGF